MSAPTRDDVLRMAREAGAGVAVTMSSPPRIAAAEFRGESLERFAAMVIADFLERSGQYVTNDASREAAIAEAVAAEREACLAEIEQGIWVDKTASEILDAIAAAIRARGQA